MRMPKSYSIDAVPKKSTHLRSRKSFSRETSKGEITSDGMKKSRSQEELKFKINQDKTLKDTGEKNVQKTEEREKRSSRVHSSRARLLKIFQHADTDKNGVLDLNELECLIARAFKNKDIDFVGKHALKKYTRMQLREHDKDGSGTIDFEEFVNLYTKLLNDPEIPPELVLRAKRADFEDSFPSAKKLANKHTRNIRPDK